MRTLTRKTHWIIFLKALQSFLLQINQTWFLYHRLLLFRKIICHGFLEKKSHLQQVAFTQKHSPNTCNPYKLPAHKHGIVFRIWCKNGRECRQLLWRYREVQCTMCILSSRMALWSKAEIQKYTFWWEKNIFEAIFPMLF